MAAPVLSNVLGVSGSGGTATFSGYVPTAGASQIVVVPNIEVVTPSITGITYDGNSFPAARITKVEGANLSAIWTVDFPLLLAASGDVVITFSGGSDFHFVGTIVGAAAGAPSVTATVSNAGSASIPLAITTTVNNSLLITGGSLGDDNDMSVSGDHTQPTADVGDGASMRGAIGEQTVAVAGAVTPTYTFTSTRNCGVVAAFAPASIAVLRRRMEGY